MLQTMLLTKSHPWCVILSGRTHTHTQHAHTDSMRGYEIAVLGHLYDNLKYTQKKTKVHQQLQKNKIYTKSKHIPTACNAQNFNSIKSSWPKGTPNAIQEQLATSLSHLGPTGVQRHPVLHTESYTHEQTKTHRLRHMPNPAKGIFGFSSCKPDWPTGYPVNDLSSKHHFSHIFHYRGVHFKNETWEWLCY